MKLTFIITLALCALAGCANPNSAKKDSGTGKPPMVTNDSLAKAALQRLFDPLRPYFNTTFKNGRIVMGDSSISLDAHVEFDGPAEELWMYAVDFSVLFKAGTETRLAVSAIGVGKNRQAAIDACLHEWFSSFGLSFIVMLTSDAGISMTGMKVFPGIPGLRGNVPENHWMTADEDMTKKIMGQIQELVQQESSNIITINILLMAGKDGIEADCRINNKISAPLWQRLRQLDWPTSAAGYVFKQFYLVKKTP